MRYMREYMPEIPSRKRALKRLPNLEKTSQDALRCLGEEASCYNVFIRVYYRTSFRGASQNKIDDDGAYQTKITKIPKAKNVNKRLRIIVLFTRSLRRIPKRGEYRIPKSASSGFAARTNRKRCLKKKKPTYGE